MAEDLSRLRDADRLPTLTEVLELGREAIPHDSPPLPPPFDLTLPQDMVAEDHQAALFDAAQAAPHPAAPPRDAPALVRQVLAEVEPMLGAALESRLQEALAPAVARATEGLMRDVQRELAGTLRELVEQAVAKALREQAPHD